MLHIRPVSDLRNKFTEIQKTVEENNEPVFLTKNGYGTMVVMSMERYSEYENEVELRLQEAELEREMTVEIQRIFYHRPNMDKLI